MRGQHLFMEDTLLLIMRMHQGIQGSNDALLVNVLKENAPYGKDELHERIRGEGFVRGDNVLLDVLGPP